MGRVGTSPGPASLAECLTQVTQVCLAPCLACGELSAEVSRAGQAQMSGGGRPRAWGVVPCGTAVIVESGAAAWPATRQAREPSRARVLLAAPPSFSDTLELGFGLVPGARQSSSVWARGAAWQHVPSAPLALPWDPELAARPLACPSSVMWPWVLTLDCCPSGRLHGKPAWLDLTPLVVVGTSV